MRVMRIYPGSIEHDRTVRLTVKSRSIQRDRELRMGLLEGENQIPWKKK